MTQCLFSTFVSIYIYTAIWYCPCNKIVYKKLYWDNFVKETFRLAETLDEELVSNPGLECPRMFHSLYSRFITAKWYGWSLMLKLKSRNLPHGSKVTGKSGTKEQTEKQNHIWEILTSHNIIMLPNYIKGGFTFGLISYPVDETFSNLTWRLFSILSIFDYRWLLKKIGQGLSSWPWFKRLVRYSWKYLTQKWG